jgi:hypothetical protein
LLGALTMSLPVYGAKVIMKDGKIYEGKIIAEPDGDVLIRTRPVEPRATLLPASEILTVVRDPVSHPPVDPQRYWEAELLASGNVFSSRDISMDPTAGLWLGGGMRLFPVIQLDAGLDWKPAINGSVAISNGTTQRDYEHFTSITGGFSGRIFPFYQRHWKIEPYLLGGYEWSRLTPKGSGDSLSGEGPKLGFGISWPLRRSWFLESRFIYRRIRYDRLDFLGLKSDVSPVVMNDNYSFGAGVAYHFF